MNVNIEGVALWLADFHLLATALLLGVLAALAVMRQPARRMAVVKSTLGALAVLAVLCALPGWSLVHLMTAAVPQEELLVVDPSQAVQVERSTTQLIPTINVDQISSEMPERRMIVEPSRTRKPQIIQRAMHWWMAVAFAHALGSAAVVLWLIGGAVMAWRIRRRASVAPAELRQMLQRVVGNESTPELLVSAEIATPVALGVRRPAIILPIAMTHPAPSPLWGGLGRGAEACTSFSTPPLIASQETTALRSGDFGSPVLGCSHPHQGEGDGRELVPILAHEWAHVRNGDLQTLAASRLLLVLLWPQPLYWVLRRSLRLDQEALADSAAAEVAGRVAYAERLLGWARMTPGAYAPRLAGAVGLWEGPSQLKRRIALLLNEQFAVMRSCSRRWRGACFAALALAAVGLSLVTLQPATRAGDETAAATDAKAGETATPDTQHTVQGGPATVSAVRVGPPAKPLPYKKNALLVKAVDGAGKPLAGLEATLYRVSYLDGTHEIVKTAATNDQGEVEFADLVKGDEIAAFAAIEQGKDAPPNGAGTFLVSLKGPGLATMTVNKSRYDVGLHGARQEVIMRPAAELRGRVVDEQGAPVSDAVVTAGLWGGALSIDGVNAVRSDEKGEFLFSDLVAFDLEAAMERQGRQSNAAFKAKRDKVDVVVFPVDAGEQLGVSQLVVRHPEFAVMTIRGGDVPSNVDVTLAPAAAITGRVVDLKTGQPASDVSVVASGLLPAPPTPDLKSETPIAFAIPTHTAKTRTDAEGRYRLDNLPAASYDVWAQPATQNWKNVEWVSRAVGGVDAKPGTAVGAPDIAIGPGGLIRGQLIDGSTSQPFKPSDDRATVRTVQEYVDGARHQTGLEQNVPVDADGRFEARVIPGKSRLHVNLSLDGKGQPYSKIDYMSQGAGAAEAAVLEVQHGEELEQQFIVNSMEEISRQQKVQSKAYKLLQEGKNEEAIAAFDAIAAKDPTGGAVRYGRSVALERVGRLAEAKADLEHLLAGGSSDPTLMNNLASILASAQDEELRNGPRAVELAKRAVVEMRKRDYQRNSVFRVLDTLASAYAETGDFEKAITTQREAIDAAPDEEKAEMEGRLKLYEDGKAYRREAPVEKPSSSSSGGLEAKDGASKTAFNSSGGWWLVRSAAADADAGRATLGATVGGGGSGALDLDSDDVEFRLEFKSVE